jgi:pimeloyl-ACP methyl ester carboxylesterase
MEPKSKSTIRKRAALILCGVFIAGSIALAIWTKHLAEQAELDYPELGRHVAVDGIELHYVERGKGRPVVLLHGAFGAIEDFTATIFDPLTRRYRAIAIDRPGHGYSQRPSDVDCTPAVQARLVHDALASLGVQRPVLVGFSWSGALVLAYALEFPNEIAGAVTINGVSHPWPGMTSALYYLPAIPLFGTWFTHTLVMPLGRSMMRSSIERAFDPEPVPLLFTSSAPVRLELRPTSFAANAEDIRELRAAVREQSPHYGEISMPLVIVVGEGDKVVTPSLHSHALHEAVAGSEIVPIAEGGHQLLYTHPKVILDAIDRAVKLADEREEKMRLTRSAAK